MQADRRREGGKVAGHAAAPSMDHEEGVRDATCTNAAGWRIKAKLQFTLGRVVKFYPGPARIEDRQQLGRFARLYNCDVLFNGQKNACGMFLENAGVRCAYDMTEDQLGTYLIQ